jgi:plastocyanin
VIAGRRRSAALLVSSSLIAACAVIGACSGAPAPTAAGTPAATVDLVAQNLAFSPRELTVPANVPFAIRFENRDSQPHNIAIHGPQTQKTEIFSGPETRTEVFAALPPGSYGFICDVHPEMTGTITSQ